MAFYSWRATEDISAANKEMTVFEEMVPGLWMLASGAWASSLDTYLGTTRLQQRNTVRSGSPAQGMASKKKYK